MGRFWTLLVCVPLFAASAATVPNRYIVDLAADPVGVRFVHGPHSAQAEQYRSLLRIEQSAARLAIQNAGGRTLGSVDTLRNSLFVEMPAAETGQAAKLASLPGVRRVYPVRLLQMALDHALPLHHVLDAWAQMGFGNAGAGVKIGMIDSGIEITHPGFSDTGFTAPAGYPIADAPADLQYTNNKVIVARSYASLFAAQDPDTSVRDHLGHGTATAMTAAGVANVAPLATITGVAPQAYLGVYKVFGTPGINDGAPEDAVLSAMEDAVNDGMNVINLSLGEALASDLAHDPIAQQVEATYALGVIVVVAAGNSGPNPATIWTPATAPHSLAVTATNNDRMFAAYVQSSNGAVLGQPGNGLNSFTPISGPLVDVTTLDGNGLACNPLPNASLNASIALIQRGACAFQIKLTNAQAAGALAAVVFDNVANEALVFMNVGGAPLPALAVANQDGLTLQQQIGSGMNAVVDFYASSYVNPQSLAVFSSAGPSIDFSVKPDLAAVGENFYTAAETLDPTGELFNASGYITTQGTSFAAPLVAGAAALLMAARPGLSMDQYRSLLIDSADSAFLVPGTPAWIQQAGGGFMNVLSALNATAAASPVSVSFGVAGGTTNLQQLLTVTNVGSATDTFQLSATSRVPGGPVPTFASASAQLAPFASAAFPIAFTADGLTAGQYDGFITIQAANAGTVANVPFWYGVPFNQAAYVTVLEQTSTGTAGGSLAQAVYFNITDASGLPVTSVFPTITAVSGGGSSLGVGNLGLGYPNEYVGAVRLGKTAGANTFQIQAGGASVTITITGQ